MIMLPLPTPSTLVAFRSNTAPVQRQKNGRLATGFETSVAPEGKPA